MHSHCAMSNEKQSEEEAQHRCVSMQTLAALNRVSPWTTRPCWLQTVEVILQRGAQSRLQPIIRPSAAPADIPDFSGGLPSCCELIYQPSSSTSHLTSPTLHFVDKESSVKGRPLRLLHLSIRSGHHLDPVPLTSRWLICDFWWMTFPFVPRGEEPASERWRVHAGITLSPRTSCSCFIIFRSPPSLGRRRLQSFMDHWGGTHQQMWHFVRWQKHCVWH